MDILNKIPITRIIWLTIIIVLFGMCEISYCQKVRYRFSLDLGVDKKRCPSANYTCPDKSIHYLCELKSSCLDFHSIVMTGSLKNMFVSGHNGVRNKIATNWKISNMNLVHWSRDLEIMAEKYLQRCIFAKDTCLTIGTNLLSVNQNYDIRRRIKGRSWAGQVVRSWYLEIGYNVNNFEEFERKWKHGKIENFTQMIWPTLEFIGCGAARFSGRYFVTCYYYPSYKLQRFTDFRFGNPCAHCSPSRQVCSLHYLGLCGIDIEISASRTLLPVQIIWLISYLLTLIT